MDLCNGFVNQWPIPHDMDNLEFVKQIVKLLNGTSSIDFDWRIGERQFNKILFNLLVVTMYGFVICFVCEQSGKIYGFFVGTLV